MLRFAACLLAVLCIAPLVLVLSSWVLPFSAETVESWQHVRQTVLNGYLVDTFWLCVGVAVLCGVLGTGSAWLTSQYDFAGRRWLEWMLILPLAMPAYVSAYAYGWLLEYGGPMQSALRDAAGWERGEYWFPAIRSLGGAVWMLGIATTPYVYLLARVAFMSQPREWWDAAATLGASSLRFFLRIALRAARPFLATGIALALMETVADIGTVTVLGVGSISAGIYRSWFFMGEPLVAARLAGLLLIFVCVLMAMEAFGRQGMRYDSLRRQGVIERPRLHGMRNIFSFLFCFFIPLAGFLLPLAVLLRLSAYGDASAFNAALPEYLWHTLRLGALAGACACAAALLMVFAERFNRAWMRAITLLANLGYAIPGAVVAVGLMMLFGWLQQHVHGGLMLTGGITGLLMAYTVRFLATAYSPLHGGMLRIPPEMDMAAASLGKSRWDVVRLVHMPLLLMPLCASFIVVFLDTVKELPATLILRPFDVKPLAVAAYEFASDDRQVEAAPYALLLVAISTLAVIGLHCLQQRTENWQRVRN